MSMKSHSVVEGPLVGSHRSVICLVVAVDERQIVARLSSDERARARTTQPTTESDAQQSLIGQLITGNRYLWLCRIE